MTSLETELQLPAYVGLSDADAAAALNAPRVVGRQMVLLGDIKPLLYQDAMPPAIVRLEDAAGATLPDPNDPAYAAAFELKTAARVVFAWLTDPHVVHVDLDLPAAKTGMAAILAGGVISQAMADQIECHGQRRHDPGGATRLPQADYRGHGRSGKERRLMANVNSVKGGDWIDPTVWSNNSVPASGDNVTISAGTAVITDVTGGNDGSLQRAGSTVIDGAAGQPGSLAINTVPTGSPGAETDLASLRVNAYGTLQAGGGDGGLGINLVVNGNGYLSGTLEIFAELAWGVPRCSNVIFNANLTIYNGARIVNGNANIACNGVVQYGSTPCAWTLQQFIDLPLAQVTTISTQPWTDVAIDGTLGGIGVQTTDYAGNLLDPLAPPFAVVYRNGNLWNGAISMTRSGSGLFSIDLAFSDGVWQLGDHGTIKVFWSQLGSDGATPQWFCQVYYWLVNRLEYQTYAIVSQALPDAPPGAAGGLPLLDGDSRAPETPNTAATLDAAVSSRVSGSQAAAIAAAITAAPAAVIAALVDAGVLQAVSGDSSSSSGQAEPPLQFTTRALAQLPINVIDIQSGTTLITSNS